MPDERTQISINIPPDYEMKLLTALAYFLGRTVAAQALACLSMYLRQSEPRIMNQLRYYAHKASNAKGIPISEYELLDMIYEHPERVDDLLKGTGKVHQPDASDVFDPTEDKDD